MRPVIALALACVLSAIAARAAAQLGDGLAPPPPAPGATRLGSPPAYPPPLPAGTAAGAPGASTTAPPPVAPAGSAARADVPPPPGTASGIAVPAGYQSYDPRPPAEPPAGAPVYPAATPATAAAPPTGEGEGADAGGGGFSFGRLLAEIGAGAVGVFVGGYGGYQLGCAMVDTSDCTPVGVIVATIGGILVTSTAVALTGDLLGGRANWGWATLGSAAGAGIGFLFALAIAEAAGDAAPFIAGVFPVAGSVFVYELVSSNRRPEPADATTATLLPIAAPLAGGGTLGIAGRF
jgi:hypothetical protein